VISREKLNGQVAGGMDMPSAKAGLLEYFRMHANKVLDNAGVYRIPSKITTIPSRDSLHLPIFRLISSL